MSSVYPSSSSQVRRANSSRANAGPSHKAQTATAIGEGRGRRAYKAGLSQAERPRRLDAIAGAVTACFSDALL
jgi:hypothetical protein